jgi:prepilin-type N-terminal cleavage/methylation domain-containing protein
MIANPAEYRSGRKGQQGFTLLELLIVIMIISLATALTIPNLVGFFQGNELDSMTRKIIGLVRQGSQLAEQEHHIIALRYDEKDRALYLETTRPRNETDLEWNPHKKGSLHLPASIRVAGLWSWTDTGKIGAVRTLFFTDRGYGAPSVLSIQEGGRQLSLVLTPFLGKIRVVEGYVDPAKKELFQ